MLKKAALAFGIVFLIIGAGGFLPFLILGEGPEGFGLLLGLFAISAIHNVIHLASGVAALASSTSTQYARLYFQIFGVVYALVTVLGFLSGGVLLGILPLNLFDNILHLAIAAASLYLGFGYKSGSSEKAAKPAA